MAAALLISQNAVYVNAEASGVNAAAQQTETESEEQTAQEIPDADIFDVDFINGTEDKSSLANELGATIGNPVIEMSSELHKNIAKFDGSSAYLYPFSQEKYDLFDENLTMECMVKFNSVPSSGEYEIFSNQQSGGIGIALENGELTFFAHVGGAYRTPKASVRPGQWYHVAGVVEGNSVRLYVNGVLQDEVTAPSAGVHFPSGSGAWNMVLGGDSDGSGGAQFLINADLSFARLYSSALDDEQLLTLSEQSFEGADIEEPKPQNVGLGLISSDGTAEEGEWNLNLHANGDKIGSIDRIEYDLVYDPSMLSYEGIQHAMSGVTVTETEEGRLHVVSSAPLSTDDFGTYGTTRLGKLNFKTGDAQGDETTLIRTENFKAYAGGSDVTAQMETQPSAEKELKIYAKDSLDINGDGVVGAGDVVLADDSMKAAAAQQAAIYPYKHVVILTLDGAGQAWNPDAVYYAENNSVIPTKRTDAETMAKRTNTYAMELLNEEFATSYTAQCVSPSISAQNYSSILHGVPWLDVPSEYQVTNDSASAEYYADFGKETSLYPSIFKAVQEAFPERQNAAFAEWTQILNGIIEPDAQVIGKGSASKESFYDVADYIRSDAFKNTAVVYMQSDWLDHVGHSTGYYNDIFWSEAAQYDDFYKAVVDALKETGEYDETLIITNADHGGSGTSHGSSDPSNMDIFIGVGGQTVDSGKRLEGGTNADISPLALAGLRISQPESMTGEVFDESAFLTQEEMSRKNRDVEEITMTRDGSRALISLDNAKNEVRAVDMVVSLNGAEIGDIDAKGGEILRQEVKDGELYLTISYDSQPKEIAGIEFASLGDDQAEVKEIMLGTAEGEEIYPDLLNTQGDLGDDPADPSDGEDPDGSKPDDGEDPDGSNPGGGEDPDGSRPDDGENPGSGASDDGKDPNGSGDGNAPSGGNGSGTGAGQTTGRAAKTGDGFPAAGAAAGMMCAGAAAAWALNRKRRNI